MEDTIRAFIEPEELEGWHQKPKHERAKLWARAKKRCKAIPREYRPHYFKGRSLRKDLTSTVFVVIIWVILTALALSAGYIH